MTHVTKKRFDHVAKTNTTMNVLLKRTIDSMISTLCSRQISLGRQGRDSQTMSCDLSYDVLRPSQHKSKYILRLLYAKCLK